VYDYIYQAVLSTKYFSIFFFSLFFPTETVMPIVGYAASGHSVSFVGAVVAATIGSTLWSIIIYTIARQFSTQAVYRAIDKYGRVAGLRRNKVERAGKWFDRNAKVALFFGRFVPGLRTAILIPAGLRRTPWGIFLVCTIAGNIIDAVLLGYAGYTIKSNYQDLASQLADFSNVIVIVLILAGLLWFLRSRRQN